MPITLELPDLLAKMKDAGIVIIRWVEPDGKPERVVCGNTRVVTSVQPLELTVGDIFEATALTEAMRAIVQGDEPTASWMLAQIADENRHKRARYMC
jgi:hypothetical protein